MQKRQILKEKVIELVNSLCTKILLYKKEVLKEHSIFEIAVYKNLTNLFQDNNQHANYEIIKDYYQDFYSQNYKEFIESDLCNEIKNLSVDIMKYLWKDGTGKSLPSERCEGISYQESERLLKCFFEYLFNAVFHHSYIFNLIVENFENTTVVQDLEFRNKVEYCEYFSEFGSMFSLQEIELNEKKFYKKAAKNIVDNLFFCLTGSSELSVLQTHLFYIKGIKINNPEYKILPGITLRCIRLNEVPFVKNQSFITKYNKENCVIIYQYKF